MNQLDAVVIRSGPNGLTAAIVLAQAGRKVVVFEAADSIGGGCRSAELTLPGFVHDACSAVHRLRSRLRSSVPLPLATYGLEWIGPPIMFAHPLDTGEAACVYRSLEHTSLELKQDGPAYAEAFGTLVRMWPRIEESVLGPLHWPRHPLSVARFGLRALQSAERLVRRLFVSEQARALLAEAAAHSMLPLERTQSAWDASVNVR